MKKTLLSIIFILLSLISYSQVTGLNIPNATSNTTLLEASSYGLNALININQTTPNITFTLSTPAILTANKNITYTNSGTVPFFFSTGTTGTFVSPGSNVVTRWNGSAWSITTIGLITEVRADQKYVEMEWDTVGKPNGRIMTEYAAEQAISTLDAEIDLKANSSNVYTKTEADALFIETEVDPTVPSYSKSLSSFSVIQGSTDALYRSISWVPSFSEIMAKPTTLSGYGITDAYPLTGNPSGFLTGITSGQINSALGYTPYNGTTNPNGYISSINSSLVTGALGFTPVTNSRSLTINGTTQDLTTNRTWTITDISGNSGTATILQTARTINGQSFNGSANITIPGSAITAIPNSSLNSSNITINGSSVSLGASATITASPNISAPSVGNSITSGTAFQPRSGGPCNILINTNVSGLIGVGTTVTVAMSATSGGTYSTIATDAVAITILTLGDKASGLIAVPTGYWVRVTYTPVGLATVTGNYTRWDL